MDSLIRSLPTILRAAGDSAEVAEAAGMVAWKHAAGEGLRDHAVPLRLFEKTLVVAVADTTWQRQLQSLSGQLLSQLNSLLGRQLVTFLEFRVDPDALERSRASREAPGRARPEPAGSGAAGSSAPGSSAARSGAVPLDLAAAAAEIPDKDLRRAFLGAAVSCLHRLETKEGRSQISDLRPQI
jgi:Dna[CI] antecedent, DciA